MSSDVKETEKKETEIPPDESRYLYGAVSAVVCVYVLVQARFPTV